MAEALAEEKVTSCRCHFCGQAVCNVNVYTRNGEITKVLPDPNWPYSMTHCTRFKNEGKAALEYHHHRDRLNFPMKRVGERGENKWEIISWDQALDEVADKLNAIREEHGASAVGAISGTSHYGDYLVSKTKFLNTFGSSQAHGNEAICYGQMTKAYECTVGWDTLHSPAPDCGCLVTCSDQRESQTATFATYEEMHARGMKIIDIQPRFCSNSRLADYHLSIRPGTDGALILTWINMIIQNEWYDRDFVEQWCIGFEELKESVKNWTPEKAAEICWLSADMIKETCRVWATSHRPLYCVAQIYEGQAPNGFNINRAIAILNCIMGTLDNGDYLVGPLDPTKFVVDQIEERDDLLPWSEQVKQIGGDRFRVMGYPGWHAIKRDQDRRWGSAIFAGWSNQGHAPTLWRHIINEISEPTPVKALILTACGALTKFSNTKLILEAFKKLELLVVIDFFPNANTMMADYVFPAADWMERDGLESYMADYKGSLPAGMRAVDPLYERRSDYDFFRGLAIRTGAAEYWPDETLRDNHNSRMKNMGMTYEELATSPSRTVVEPVEDFHYAMPNPATGQAYGMGTPSGKCELRSNILEELGYSPIPYYEEPNFSPVSTPEYAKEYPFILCTGARIQPYYHSEGRQIKSWRPMHPDPMIEMNVQDAQMMEPPIYDGDWAWIETHIGRIKMKVRTTNGINPGVVHAEHNWWFPEKDPKYPSLFGTFESNINAVLDDDPDKCGVEGGTYTCNTAMCKVYKA